MAKKAGAKTVQTATRKRKGVAVRLEMDPEDIERLERVARRLGLSRASFARMAVLARIGEEELKGGSR
jgi:hypothetical protein